MTTSTAPTRGVSAQAAPERTPGGGPPVALGGVGERSAEGLTWVTRREAAPLLGLKNARSVGWVLAAHHATRIQLPRHRRETSVFYVRAEVEALALARQAARHARQERTERAQRERQERQERKQRERPRLRKFWNFWRSAICPRCGMVCHLQPLARSGCYRLVDPFTLDGHLSVCMGETSICKKQLETTLALERPARGAVA